MCSWLTVLKNRHFILVCHRSLDYSDLFLSKVLCAYRQVQEFSGDTPVDEGLPPSVPISIYHNPVQQHPSRPSFCTRFLHYTLNILFKRDRSKPIFRSTNSILVHFNETFSRVLYSLGFKKIKRVYEKLCSKQKRWENNYGVN